MKKLTAKAEINIPKIHLENLNHPQLNSLKILNLFVLFLSILVIFFSKTYISYSIISIINDVLQNKSIKNPPFYYKTK